MIGRIITASTRPTVNIVRPLAEAGPAKKGGSPGCRPPTRGRARARARGPRVPESVDHTGDGRQQVDDVARARREPARRVVGDVEGDRDGERRGDHQGERSAEQRPWDQRCDVVAEPLAARDVLRGGGESGDRLADEERREPGEDEQDEDPGAPGAAGEDAVTRPSDSAPRRGSVGAFVAVTGAPWGSFVDAWVQVRALRWPGTSVARPGPSSAGVSLP